MGATEYVRKLRHPWSEVAVHWTFAALIFIDMATGYMIYANGWPYLYGNSPPAFGYYTNYGLHATAGILLLLVNGAIWIYIEYTEEEIREHVPDLQDMKNFVKLAKWAVNPFAEYPIQVRVWDREKGDWHNHYHPLQKLYFFGELVLVAVMVLTGFGIHSVYYGASTPLFSALGFASAFMSLELMKQLHLLTFWLFLAMIAFHVYYVLTHPSVLVSMFNRYMRTKVKE